MESGLGTGIRPPPVTLIGEARGGAAADGDLGVSQRHCGFRQGLPVQTPTGNGDGRTRENTSYEDRIRQCRGFGGPPKHVVVTRLPRWS